MVFKAKKLQLCCKIFL